MHAVFGHHVQALQPACEALLASAPFAFDALPAHLPAAGVYLFSEGERHLYVGRTNRMRQRLKQHCLAGSGHRSAPFAFRLAREACGLLRAAYTPQGGRAALMQEPQFAAAFGLAKQRLRTMQIRTIEQTHPLGQALLEMYVAVVVQAPYNDFDNH